MTNAVKMADGADDIIEGLGIPFGGSFNGKDIDGEYFTKSTDLAVQWFGPNERPVLYHHGRDADAGLSVVGRVSSYKTTDLGVWTQAQLDKSSEYFDAITALVKSGTLYFSSGAMAHLTRRKKSGEITVWPWVELSLTPTPANPLAEVDFGDAKAHFEAAGLKMAPELDPDFEADDATKATLSAAAKKKLPDSDFAYIDKDGNRHLPIHDAAHVRAALSRFNQTQFESPSAKTTARRKIMARAKKLGVDAGNGKSWPIPGSCPDGDAACEHCGSVKALPDGPTLMSDDDGGPYPEGSYEDLATDIADALREQTGGYPYVVCTFPDYAIVRCCDDDSEPDSYGMPSMSYYRVGYTLDDDGEPVLGEMQKVEPAMVPSESAKSGTLPLLPNQETPLAMQAARLGEYAALVTTRTEDVIDRRAREGRVLSAANRERLTATADVIDGALKAMRDLLASTEPQSAKAASVETTRLMRRTRDAEALSLYATTLEPVIA